MSNSKNTGIQTIISSVESMSELIPNLLIGIKNLESEHVYISKYCRKIFNVSNGETGLISVFPNYSLISSIEDDRQIFSNNSAKNFIVFASINDRLTPFIFSKLPIIDSTTSKAIGLIYNGIEYPYFNMHEHINESFNGIDFKLLQNFKLTQREKEVIFFFMANCASNEIATSIGKIYNKNISKSTIDSIFSNQLYLKFNVISRIQLQEKLAKFGYATIIPKSVIHKSVYTAEDKFHLL